MAKEILLSEEIFDSLYQATLAIAGAQTQGVVLKRIVDSARILVEADYGAIGIIDEANSLSRLITSNVSPEIAAEVAESPAGVSLLNRLVSERKPVRQVDVDEDSQSIATTLPMDSFLAVPVMSGDELLGNIFLANKAGEAGFSENDQKLVEMLAAHASIAIRKSQLLLQYKENSKQVEERNRQLAALNRAALAITGELTLDKVLQQIVESARELADARYAALGVPSSEGTIETFVHSGMSADKVARISHLPRGLGLLGAITREKRSIRIARLADDPRSSGFPPHHPQMTSFLGVPVVLGGEILGNLYLTDKLTADEFSGSDQELVEMLAAHAAIVIQNSRLYEQIGRLAIVAERARIGMDLHDGVIQSIYAVGLTLESARLTLPENKQEADLLLANAIEGLNDTIRDIRNFILDLRPHRFSGDLRQGVARLVREFQANTMVPVTLDMTLNSGISITAPVARAMFLTTQEALANIARHARASQVSIKAKHQEAILELVITDDGRGFDTKAQVQTVGHGLSNMRARAESLKGAFTITSVPGEGTSIRLQLPCC